MKILFRVDSSILMGSGHVMRCLTLAQALQEKNHDIVFVCRELPGNLIEFIEKKGFKVYALHYSKQWSEQGGSLTEYQQWLGATLADEIQQLSGVLEGQYDWLIVDHYGLDQAWESKVRHWAKKIMVIDDLADRQHDCDLLLDQNFYLDKDTRYQNLVPSHARCLLGPKYALLRPEFAQARKNFRAREEVKRVLIFFGGSDPSNETEKAIHAILQLKRADLEVDVVVGGSNPNKLNIGLLCNQFGLNYYCQINNMAELMVNADLAIGAGGATTWERCCLGLPAIVVAIAENQVKIAEDCAQAGAIEYLGSCSSVSLTAIEDAVKSFSVSNLKLLSLKGSSLVDALGVERAIKVMNHT